VIRVHPGQDGTNTPFNVFFNPSFVNKYNPSKEAEIALSLYDRTGDNKALPNFIDKKFTFHGIPFELNGKQQSDLQRWVGERSKDFYTSLINNPEFQNASDEGKLKAISNYLIDLRQRGMAKLISDELDQVPQDKRFNYFKNLIKNNQLKRQDLEAILKKIGEYKLFEYMRGGAGEPALQQ
jgi:hypothetical protein